MPCYIDMAPYTNFLLFKNKKLINEKELEFAIDFICLNLNLNPDSLKWYAFYTYANYCKQVLLFKEEKQIAKITKLGESVCKGEVVNFLDNQKHKYPNCTCGSTYMQFDPLKYSD